MYIYIYVYVYIYVCICMHICIYICVYRLTLSLQAAGLALSFADDSCASVRNRPPSDPELDQRGGSDYLRVNS